MTEDMTRHQVPHNDLPVITRRRQHVGLTLSYGQDVLPCDHYRPTSRRILQNEMCYMFKQRLQSFFYGDVMTRNVSDTIEAFLNEVYRAGTVTQ